MDALTLALALRLDGKRLSPARVGLGALAGTAAAALIRARLPQRAWQTALLLPVAALMALAAGWRGRAALTGALLVMSAAGLLGGLVLALSGALGSLPAAYALAAGFALLTAARAARAAPASAVPASAAPADARGVRVRLLIRYRGRQAVFAALLDSGNSLRDYLSHRPVIVLPEAAGRERLGLGDAALRPILAQTAGGRQMMWCFLPDEAFLLRRGVRRRLRAAVALSPGLPPSAPALLPGALCRRTADNPNTDR